MGSGKNKRVVRRKRKRKINKKKLLLLVIVVVLFVFGIFKLTQGAILAIQNIIPKKENITTVVSPQIEYETLPTEVDKNIKKKYTILIDPGHGGNDKGTIAQDKKTFEKDLTLKIGALVAKNLTKQNDIQVIVSRNEDKYISLGDRAKLANEQNVDLLVSIHLNGQVGGNEATGIETYYVTGRDDGSAQLAQQIQKTVTSYIDIRDRGVKHAKFQVLQESKMTAVLIECGFLSNKEETKKLQDKEYQEDLSEGIAQGILSYLDQKTS